LILCRAVVHSWETSRTLLSFTFGRLITRDAWVLALSDFIMVASMFVCVPFVKGLKNGTYRYYWTGVVIQHVWQTMFLGMAVWWGWYRQWYWVQAGFLVLRESLSLRRISVYSPSDL
jgi:sterol O-acyltransferase